LKKYINLGEAGEERGEGRWGDKSCSDEQRKVLFKPLGNILIKISNFCFFLLVKTKETNKNSISAH